MQSTMWFIRSLAELYESGIPVAKAVKLSADACGNLALAQRYLNTIPLINEGKSLTEVFTQTHALPIGVLNILASAEASGAWAPLCARRRTWSNSK